MVRSSLTETGYNIGVILKIDFETILLLRSRDITILEEDFTLFFKSPFGGPQILATQRSSTIVASLRSPGL